MLKPFIYLEKTIINNRDNNSYKSKKLLFRDRIIKYAEDLEQIRLNWNSYFLHDKTFRRFVRKNYYYDQLSHILRNQYSIKCVTNTWLTTYEILFRNKHVFEDITDIYVVFNIDLPGEVISTVEYFFNKHLNISNFKWLAVQHNNTKVDSNDIYQLYKKNSTRWITSDMCFSNLVGEVKKNTQVSCSSSELMSIKSSRYISSKINKIRHENKDMCNIFISVIELTNGNILDDYTQYITAFSVLRLGGILIAKSNNIHLPFKIWMISIISRYFEKFMITKPISSLPYESDIYILGVKFKGISRNDLDKLFHILSTFKRRYVDKILTEIYADTIQIIYKMVREIVEREIESDQSLIKLFNSYNNNQLFYNDIEEMSNNIIKNYINEFGIEK